MINLNRYSEIIVWGAPLSPSELESQIVGGITISYAIDKIYSLLENNGYISKLKFFVDMNPKRQGQYFHDKEIKAPIEILKYPDALIIINNLHFIEIPKMMKEMGAKNDCMMTPYYFHHMLLNRPYSNLLAKEHVKQYKEQIKELFEIDDIITQRYLEIIFFVREKCEDDLYPLSFYDGTIEYMHYFCDSRLAPVEDVTLIDIGAYDGESIELVRKMYQEKFKKCIAFEPNIESIEILKKYVKNNKLENKVTILPYALGRDEKMLYFTQAGSASTKTQKGKIKVTQKAFDSLLPLKVIGDVMLKMDIEGAEMDALYGMKDFIKRYQPYLAICIYHKESDLYDIPYYIKSLCSDYRLFLRGGWHLECWAIPKRHFERTIK